MAKLHLQGYLSEEVEDGYKLTDEPRNTKNHLWDFDAYVDLTNEVANFAEQHGVNAHFNEGLGVTKTIIPEVSLRIYFTDNKSTLDEATEALLEKLYGRVDMEIHNTGYSEYTITGFEVEDFRIGGHDIKNMLDSHIGEYMHLVMEVDEW